MLLITYLYECSRAISSTHPSDFGKEWVANVWNQQANHVRPLRDQITCNQIWLISKLRNFGEHALPCESRNLTFVVYHTGNGFYGDLRLLRHIPQSYVLIPS